MKLLDPGGSDTVALAKGAAAMANLTVAVEGAATSTPHGQGCEDVALRAVLVDLDSPGAQASVTELRLRLATVAVPVIGLARAVSDLSFEEAFSIGIDDCCPYEELALGRLLRAVAQHPPAPLDRLGDRALVADRDVATRMLVGRVFRNAGWDVAFASTSEETATAAADGAVRVVVCSAELAEPWLKQAPPWRRSASAGGTPAWILSTPPRLIPSVLAQLGSRDEGRVAVHDAFSAPANLLFIANEQLHRPVSDARRSARLLYGNTVRFRPAGRASEQLGYCYNISAGGLYVRTLAPPSRGEELWLELVPPRSDRSVHLEAKVVWARAFDARHGATVPPGFGVELSGATPRDAERYQRGYDAFLAERVALKTSLGPTSG